MIKAWQLSCVIAFSFTAASSPEAANISESLPVIGHPKVDPNPPVNLAELSLECRRFIQGPLQQRGWQWGFVAVPEDWHDPGSQQIRIFYYYKNPRSRSPGPPVVFLNGGPFSSYQGRMEALDQQVARYDRSGSAHPFLMIDQRGTGCSTPNLPDGSSDNSRYAKYGSFSIAHDAEVIRQKLFDAAKWKIFAQSYGGFLAVRYLQLFPASVTELHLHAPVFHESMTDFFRMRIVRQNEVLKLFYKEYPRHHLDLALEKIAGPLGAKYCWKGLGIPKVCGRALADLIVATIGQGKGRKEGSTEVWDSVKTTLLHLAQSDPNNPHDDRLKKFLDASSTSGAFFYNPSINLVFTLWAQEFPFLDGNPMSDCQAAYRELRDMGIAVENLPVDECRIINDVIPEAYKKGLSRDYAKTRGTDFLTQDRIVQLLKRHPNVKAYLYTAELDTFTQVESLHTLISSGAFTDYTNFTESGHAGWLFEPLVWRRLMDLP